MFAFRSIDFGTAQHTRTRLYFVMALTTDESILDSVAHMLTSVFPDLHTPVDVPEVVELMTNKWHNARYPLKSWEADCAIRRC